MARKRYLPEAAYDFFARDGRDGEEGPRRYTLASARKDASAMRKPLKSYQRPAITVEWEVNEKKVLRLLENAQKHEEIEAMRKVADLALFVEYYLPKAFGPQLRKLRAVRAAGLASGGRSDG